MGLHRRLTDQIVLGGGVAAAEILLLILNAPLWRPAAQEYPHFATQGGGSYR